MSVDTKMWMAQRIAELERETVSLRAELEKAKTDLNVAFDTDLKMKALVEQESELSSVRAELEQVKRDAARYKWLRDRPSLIGWDWWNEPVPVHVNITPEFMDAAIDEQLTRETK